MPGDQEALKRLGGGRWQTRDERFTIEPQSGTWVIVDAEQTDDLGLPLIRGPFPSLTAAKGAIASARASAPASSPLPDRAEALRRTPSGAGTSDPSEGPRAPDRRRRTASAHTTTTPAGSSPPAPTTRAKVQGPKEPRWIASLAPGDRRRARHLITRLTDAGARDAEGIARRDVAGKVPAAATFAVLRAIRGLGLEADPGRVAALLADGSDPDLEVRWRLVDGEGRPITIDPRDLGER